MPRYSENDWDDDWSSSADDPADEEENGEPLIPCPHCRQEMFEDLVSCPHCGNYISREDAPADRKPMWVIVTVLVCLLMALLWIFTLN